MSKLIRDYIHQNKKKIIVQARVDAEIVAAVKKIMDKGGLTWANVLTGCLKMLVEEKSGKK